MQLQSQSERGGESSQLRHPGPILILEVAELGGRGQIVGESHAH